MRYNSNIMKEISSQMKPHQIQGEVLIQQQQQQNNTNLPITNNISINQNQIKHKSFKYVPTKNITKDLIDQYAKAFVFNSSSIEWCIPSNAYRNMEPSGLLYVKVPKTASSTIAGVVERIARNSNRTHYLNSTTKKCSIRNTHYGRENYYKRVLNQTFLFGSIRHPTARGISRAFFRIKRSNVTPTNTMILSGLETNDPQFGSISKGQGGFQVQYLSLFKIPEQSGVILFNNTKSLNYTAIHDSIQHIMKEYNFIILSERLDESFIVLKHFLQLQLGDLLHMSTKVSGGYTFDNTRRKCVKSHKTNLTSRVSKYFSSNEWMHKIYGDLLLHSIVNASLDLTIENTIGRDIFEQDLIEFRNMKRLAQEACSQKTFFPCDVNGTYQKKSLRNCYRNDWGCGFKCLNKFAKSWKRQGSNHR